METLNFKTNIKTPDHVAAVTLNLNSIEQIDGWNIAIQESNHVLTVQTTDNRIADLVQQAVMDAGFQAELIAS